jgi:FlaA1/EpsC-like NDP-sugar epimerase
MAPKHPQRPVSKYLAGKRIVVTGVCGAIGQQLASQLLDSFELDALIGIDNNESELAALAERYAGRRAQFLLCDVRDRETLIRETRKIDVLFHAAAYKHVSMCERSPLEAIQTNILGVHNVTRAAVENGIARVVFTSSDKAVNPTSVMGTSKLMGERLVTAAAVDPHVGGAVFLSVRFGNVLGSRGSVVPVFQSQIRKGGPVTLTDTGMTRFIMSIKEAVRLVIDAAALGQPGDVMITKMPAIRISDLASVMVKEYAPLCGRRPKDIEIRVVGPKPGEKLYEELMNEEEIRHSLELERYFVVRPAIHPVRPARGAYRGAIVAERVAHAYNSANAVPLTREQLASFLRENGLLDRPS